MFGQTLKLMGRNMFQNSARLSHGGGTFAGDNLPFSITNRYKLTALFIVFFSSGFGAPFLIVRHQLLKK